MTHECLQWYFPIRGAHGPGDLVLLGDPEVDVDVDNRYIAISALRTLTAPAAHRAVAYHHMILRLYSY